MLHPVSQSVDTTVYFTVINITFSEVLDIQKNPIFSTVLLKRILKLTQTLKLIWPQLHTIGIRGSEALWICLKLWKKEEA